MRICRAREVNPSSGRDRHPHQQKLGLGVAVVRTEGESRDLGSLCLLLSQILLAPPQHSLLKKGSVRGGTHGLPNAV